MCKELASYASTVNPFSLELVYNSSYAMKYGEENYDVGGQQGLGMHLWCGGTPECDAKGGEGGAAKRHRAGPEEDIPEVYRRRRTAHYFSQDEEKKDGLYYDEDGLGLKIDEYLSQLLSDDR